MAKRSELPVMLREIVATLKAGSLEQIKSLELIETKSKTLTRAISISV